MINFNMLLVAVAVLCCFGTAAATGAAEPSIIDSDSDSDKVLKPPPAAAADDKQDESKVRILSQALPAVVLPCVCGCVVSANAELLDTCANVRM
jgi:hypothetical protein